MKFQKAVEMKLHYLERENSRSNAYGPSDLKEWSEEGVKKDHKGLEAESTGARMYLKGIFVIEF